jgi:hypothetical protein
VTFSEKAVREAWKRSSEFFVVDERTYYVFRIGFIRGYQATEKEALR